MHHQTGTYHLGACCFAGRVDLHLGADLELLVKDGGLRCVRKKPLLSLGLLGATSPDNHDWELLRDGDCE